MAAVTAYLGLGTNLGRRKQNLSDALRTLANSTEIKLVRSSSVYETAPWGFTDQPSFLNCAVQVSTSLAPPELLQLAKEIERDQGRQESFRYGPRLIDIDILLYGQDTILLRRPDLQIPHRCMTERAFVLVPLAEIAPDAVHPTLNVPVEHLLKHVAGTEDVRLWSAPLTG